jgi:hypothetical protein
MAQESHGGATWVPDVEGATAAGAPDRQRSEEHQIQEGTGHNSQVTCKRWMYMSFFTHNFSARSDFLFWVPTLFQDHALLNSIEELQKKASAK